MLDNQHFSKACCKSETIKSPKYLNYTAVFLKHLKRILSYNQFCAQTNLFENLTTSWPNVDGPTYSGNINRVPWYYIKIKWQSRDVAVVRALTSHHCGPGLIPGSGIMWVEFVRSCRCSEGFSPDSPVFLPSQKPTLQTPIQSVDEEPLRGCATAKSICLFF